MLHSMYHSANPSIHPSMGGRYDREDSRHDTRGKLEHDLSRSIHRIDDRIHDDGTTVNCSKEFQSQAGFVYESPEACTVMKESILKSFIKKNCSFSMQIFFDYVPMQRQAL